MSSDYIAVEKRGTGDHFLTTFLKYMNTGDLLGSIYRAHIEVTKWLMSRELHRTLTTQRESS